MKRYNYKTKKIYESDSAYVLTLNEYDGDGKLIDIKDFEDTYSTVDDAIDDAYNIMRDVANNDGFYKDDILYDEDGDTVTFTIDGIGSWIFTVNNKGVEGVSDDYDTDDSTYDDNSDDNDDYEDEGEYEDEDNVNESVAERFARLRRMFESDDSDDKSDDDDASDDKSDDDNASDDKSDEDENEDEEMQAVIITVKKGDEDKCKDELIDAGVAEEDIEILDADEDAENVDIRIDVNSVIELKDYLSKKGIDLEEEIGGEIVSDDETDDENEDGTEEEDENKKGDDEEDFDFDNLGDIFGADEDDEK